MNEDLHEAYEQYLDYVAGRCTDFDDRFVRHASSRFGSRVLTFEHFCLMWQRWVGSAATGSSWRSRWELGYDHAQRSENRRRAA